MSPWKPRRPCGHRGCPELTDDVYCAKHKPIEHEPFAKRASPSRRGYGRAHQRWRHFILGRDPLCVDCLKENPPRTTAATEAHHIDGDVTNLSAENGAGLCKPHHSKHTAASRTSFGRNLRG